MSEEKKAFHIDKKVDSPAGYDNCKWEHFITVLKHRDYWNSVLCFCKCFTGVLVALSVSDYSCPWIQSVKIQEMEMDAVLCSSCIRYVPFKICSCCTHMISDFPSSLAFLCVVYKMVVLERLYLAIAEVKRSLISYMFQCSVLTYLSVHLFTLYLMYLNISVNEIFYF